MHDIRPGQSTELLKELHILTRDGRLNQDSRRKLKQVNHLAQFAEPLIAAARAAHGSVAVVDHGAGKSYFGFMLYDLYFKDAADQSVIFGVETRAELVRKAESLAQRLGFLGMRFVNMPCGEAAGSPEFPARIDVVTALHACDTATDDAIDFALTKNVSALMLAPCCQAEVASALNRHKNQMLEHTPLTEIWRHPLHTREFGSHLTNVLRCLRLEAHGYRVTVTELVGWEHAVKNELIIAQKQQGGNPRAARRLTQLLKEFGLEELRDRFSVPARQN